MRRLYTPISEGSAGLHADRFPGVAHFFRQAPPPGAGDLPRRVHAESETACRFRLGALSRRVTGKVRSRPATWVTNRAGKSCTATRGQSWMDQSVSAALPGVEAAGIRAGPTGVRGRLPRIWLAADDSD